MSILIDKQYKDYYYTSRYSAFPFYFNTNDNKYIYGTTSQLSQGLSYRLYKVKQNDTLDTLALDFYNNPTLYWVIADFNHIQDPYIKLEVGTEIKIPTLSEIVFEEN